MQLLESQATLAPHQTPRHADAVPALSTLLDEVQEHAQVVITDVTTDPGFAPHREIALASGFRAVQSTPLVNRAGHLVGMVSTHYPEPTTPPRRDLQIASRFGALAGESLTTLLTGTPALSPQALEIPGFL